MKKYYRAETITSNAIFFNTKGSHNELRAATFAYFYTYNSLYEEYCFCLNDQYPKQGYTNLFLLNKLRHII